MNNTIYDICIVVGGISALFSILKSKCRIVVKFSVSINNDNDDINNNGYAEEKKNPILI